MIIIGLHGKRIILSKDTDKVVGCAELISLPDLWLAHIDLVLEVIENGEAFRVSIASEEGNAIVKLITERCPAHERVIVIARSAAIIEGPLDF